MLDQSVPPTSPQPPPLQPLHPPSVPYAGSAPQQPLRYAKPEAQQVFDIVTGPNVRLVDNLVQLGCVVVGGVLGVGVTMLISDRDGGSAFLVVGGIIGVVAGLVLSGAVIGIIRGRNAMRRR